MPISTASELLYTNPVENGAGTILLAEDSVLYQHMIGSHLKEWGFDFVCAKDGRAAWTLLQGLEAPRLALLDWVLPEIDGVELCRKLRHQAGYAPYTYTILLTAKNQKQEMLQAMAAGADDFLAKSFDPLELKARLLVGKRIVDLQQKLVSANHALQFAACHDFLTGAWNRAEILAFLDRELARARRNSSSVGIVLLDVDHFKNVNDRFGHEAGDFVLKELVIRLSAAKREYDGAGRYGGEEFLLVLPGCDRATTSRRADEIRKSIARTPIVTPQGALNITVSMGVTVSESGVDSGSMLRSADLALYEAKRNGRNRVELACHAVELIHGVAVS